MDPGRIRLLLREAITSAKAGNTTWARDCLGRVLRADPRNEVAWLWLSAVLETTDEKRFCLEKILVINPDNQRARNALRWLEQRAEEEASAAEPQRTICPMCGEPNLSAAFRCVNCGQNLFVTCPSCGERVDIDLPSCNTCGLEIADSSDGPSYFFRLGELYLEHGQPKAALEALEKTLLLEPDFPRVAQVAAEAFFVSGQRDLAIQSLQRAVEEAPDAEQRRQLLVRLASFHRDQGQTEEAGKLYQRLLQEDQERGDLHADLYAEVGQFYETVGDPAAARHSYEMALTLDETLHEARLALAELYLKDGNEFRALRELRKLETTDPEIAKRAQVRIEEVRPSVPESFRNRWQETARGMGSYFVAGLLLLLLTVGRQWDTITTWNIVGLLTFLLGGFFLTAAITTPSKLPTLAPLARLAEKPAVVRMRARRKKAEPTEKAGGFSQWHAQATKALVARLRLTQARLRRAMKRAGTALSRRWQKIKLSRPMRWIAAVPQNRFFRALAALKEKWFFRTTGRLFRRLWQRIRPRRVPRQKGPSLFQRMAGAMREGRNHLRERADRIEISEMQIYRWMTGVLGALLLVLASGLVVFF